MPISLDENTSIVKGCSMLPLLQTGDRVILQPIRRDEIQCGDILVFVSASGTQIIHRVIRLSPLQTRGDNCEKDDPPVPENSPLHKAIFYRRNQHSLPLSSGKSGLQEFRRHQRQYRWRQLLHKIALPLERFNPFKISYQRLTKTVFQGREVYYFRRRPVAWQDSTGWHWMMRFAHFFIQAPPSKETTTPQEPSQLL